MPPKSFEAWESGLNFMHHRHLNRIHPEERMYALPAESVPQSGSLAHLSAFVGCRGELVEGEYSVGLCRLCDRLLEGLVFGYEDIRWISKVEEQL